MSRNLQKIQQELENEIKLMEIHKTNSKYDQADKSRIKIEQLEKEHEERYLYQLHHRHKKQHVDLVKNNEESQRDFDKRWDETETKINNDLKKNEAAMMDRHKKQIEETKKELDVQFSPKTKESSELLNLRKMEEHMVKQKLFSEAHKVQQQIFEMERQEKKAWMEKRAERIQVAINTLKGKQNVQLASLRLKYKTMLDESIRDRKIEEEILHQKFENLHRDLKNQQERQTLNFKGQFKTRGGRDSPQRTRSTFTC